MPTSRLRALLVGFLLSTGVTRALAADTGTAPGASTSDAAISAPFINLDKFFVKNYSHAAFERQKTSRPLMVILGFEFNMLCADGTTKTMAATQARFNELKAVSHLGACLYPLALRHWSDPADTTWLNDMASCHKNIEDCVASADKVDWTSDAWPGGQDKLRDFVKSSLLKVSKITADAVATKEFTRDQYSAFIKDYEPTMQSTFYLSSLGDVYDSIKVLKQWKKEVGDEKWGQMWVVIGGSQGRTTAGLTPDTSAPAMFLATLMSKEQANTHFIMAPAAFTIDQALTSAGMTMQVLDLAQAMFPTKEAQKSAFYPAMQSFDKPIALQFIRESLQGLKDGNAKDAVLGIGIGH